MVTKEKDDELALFLELRRREKDKDQKNNLLLLLGDDDGDNASSLLGANLEAGSPISKIVSSAPPRKTAAEKFLDSENDKSDYDWLLTPPGTPLFPSLEKESQKTGSQNGMSNARPIALKSRLMNVQEEPASKTNVASKHMTLPSALNSSSTGNRRPSSSGGPTSAARPATPTARPTLPATVKSSRHPTPTSRATLPSSKPAAPPVRSSTPTRPARSSTPTARPSAPRSSTPTARASAPRSSTPTARSSVGRSSTPTARSSLPASKPASRSATPSRRPSTPSSAPSGPPARSASITSSKTKSAPAASKSTVPSRGSSPTVKSRPWKPNEIPGFSLDAPPNLRTSLPERPSSASRGRPGGASSRSSSVEAGSGGRPRQQSCSPARGRLSNGSTLGGQMSICTKSRAQTNGSDDVNPVLMGTKMVERVVNARKLVPPKLDDHNSSARKSSNDSTGFGRTLSKKSLDMALRHMDIKRTISTNLRPLMTNIPASSMYSVRSGGSTKSKSRTISVSDSPLATSSNASSEPSVNNNFFSIDGIELEDNDFGSERGNSSPISQRDR